MNRAGSKDTGATATVGAQRLNLSSALLALSVLADSGIEHYRGSFQNKAMYAPLAVAALTLGASVVGMADRRPRRHGTRDSIYALAAATGLAGLAFHTYNIGKRPGGFSWLNLFYAAPIGAPAGLVLAGLLGKSAESVRHSGGGITGRTLAILSALGLAGTVLETALLHFRGAFHNPAMVLPVSVPPLAATLLGAATCTRGRRIGRLARAWLKFTALLGFAGVGFHAYGVARNMGGWRNWSQNVLDGPPLPAPPSYTALALAGLAALELMEKQHD